jgi:hypothetical protein
VRGAFALLGAGVGGLARSVSGPAALAAPTAVADGGTGLLESAAVSSPPLRDADYWQFADWLQGALDRLWNEAHQTYTTDARLSACVLMTHAIAALKGHDGSSRNDTRARALALALCESPPFRPARNGRPTRHTDPRSESQAHAPGWVSSVAQADSPQHITVDPKVARALYYAWRARDELNLPPSTVDRIVQCVSSVAHSPFFRYPNVRLNQINFAAELQACAASMTGDTSLLRRDYRHQLARFVNGATRSVRPWRIPNLGPSYSFHRNPFQRAGANQNIESAEYANIVLDVIYYYEQAKLAGMRPLSKRQARTLRAWVKRALPAYWTHSGYLNWDTGLYLYRWHLSRYWAWSGQGLLAIATSRNFVNDNERLWGKYMFDRSLALYERFTERWDDDRREPGSSLYGITTKFTEGRHFELARFQALAAEAVLRGLGDAEAQEPPPLYAFDPQIGRLTVTTPSYNTAITAVSNGAFPYGGIELARLFDSRQRVVSHIGGRAPAGMGLIVSAPGRSIIAASQRPRAVLRPGRRPIALTRSPRGRIRKGGRYPRSPYAGRFTVLETDGFSRRAGVVFRSRYRFSSDRIDVSWRVSRSRTDALSAEALFPSWGEATINVHEKTGEVVRLTATTPVPPIELAAVDYFFVDGSEGGYVVVPHAFSAGAFVGVIQPSEQSSNPRPGPSLSIRLARPSRWSHLSLDVAIGLARDPAEAAAIVGRLRGGSL